MKSSTPCVITVRVCRWCQSSYKPNTSWQTTCSNRCGYSFQNNKNKRGQTNFKLCMRCDKSLADKRANAIYCSKSCKSMDHTFKYRGTSRFVTISRRREIYERDSAQCYLCKIKLDFKNFELDHLLPVSRGAILLQIMSLYLVDSATAQGAVELVLSNY